MTPNNPMDAAVSSATAAFRRMSTAASGPLGMANPDLVLSEAEALSKALAFVKAAARAEIASRKRKARDAAKEAIKNAAQKEINDAELARRRAEQDRLENMSGRNHAVEGLAVMAKAMAA